MFLNSTDAGFLRDIDRGTADGWRATTATRPPPALGTARRHAGLVRIEAGFDRTLEVAKLALDYPCAEEPVQAMELRADSVGMHEAASLSEPADRLSALALAGMMRG